MSVSVTNKPHRKRLARRKPAKRPAVEKIHREEVILRRKPIFIAGPVRLGLGSRKHIRIDHRPAALLAEKPFKLFESGKAPALAKLGASLFNGDFDLLMIKPYRLAGASFTIPDFANRASEPFDPEPEIDDKVIACHEAGCLSLQRQRQYHYHCQQTGPESRMQCHHHAKLSR